MRRAVLSLALVLVALAAAAVEVAAARSGTRLAVRGSTYGRILVDGSGRTLYAFTRDGRGPSACSGACARAWPPLIVSSRPRAGNGTRVGLIGTRRRGDGRLQATYRGRPLYFYVGDRRAGDIFCQDVFEFGGRWLLVGPRGSLVR